MCAVGKLCSTWSAVSSIRAHGPTRYQKSFVGVISSGGPVVVEQLSPTFLGGSGHSAMIACASARGTEFRCPNSHPACPSPCSRLASAWLLASEPALSCVGILRLSSSDPTRPSLGRPCDRTTWTGLRPYGAPVPNDASVPWARAGSTPWTPQPTDTELAAALT